MVSFAFRLSPLPPKRAEYGACCTTTLYNGSELPPYSSSNRKSANPERLLQMKSLLITFVTLFTTHAVVLGLSTPATTTRPTPTTAKATSFNQEALEKYKFPRTWVPMASTFELDPNRPTPLQFLGQTYVTYQDNDENWIVMDDTCPHRLAPLSEGRIDRSKNVIQCSYHGWEFDSHGKCVRIPQATERIEQAALNTKLSCVTSLPVHVENQVLFVWPWKDDVLTVANNVSACPEGLMEDVNPIMATYTRDLPYGWDSLVENLIDPSHVPFAHHGMQGKRDDAIPINMTLPTLNKEKGFSFTWGDRTMGMMRAGTGEFRAPFLTKYNADFDTGRPFRLSVFCVPTRPGWSRAIILSEKSNADLETTDGDDKKSFSLMRAVFKRIPIWLIHLLSNRFLDSDLAFLHYQERKRRQEKQTYFMPAPADRCIAALQKWVSTYTNICDKDDLPATPLPRSTLFDRYSQHTSHCKHCQAGLKTIQTWRRATYAILATSVILASKFLVAKVFVLLSLGLLRALFKLEGPFKEGEFKHYENH